MAGRLTSAVAGVQTRSWVYDNRGFLLSETHPEKGVNGNGTVTYQGYDAAGLPGGMTDGPHDLGFTYDFMGRHLETRDLNEGSRLVTELFWDGAAGPAAGKLRWAKRYNYVERVWPAPVEEIVEVKQIFKYHGLGGAVSAKITRFTWSSDDVRFKQLYSYDDLGNVTKHTYPFCNLPVACKNQAGGPNTGPKPTYTYDQGRLTAVPGWADAITYHPSGLWKRIDHANGVSDHQDLDVHFSSRPGRLYTQGVIGQGFDSGVMTYDGSGNLMGMDTDPGDPTTATASTFTYDKVNRLTEASFFGGADVQRYAYDRWGNLTARSGATNGPILAPVDPSTNRLVGATHDGAGNLLTPPPQMLVPGVFAYDTTNRMIAQGHLRYVYDAFGERAMTVGSTTDEWADFFLRDLDQRLVSKVRWDSSGWSRERDYFYAGNRLLGRDSSEPSWGERHFHLDHLGSVRLSTLSTGDHAISEFFMPYGERLDNGSHADSLLFAGPHERDFSTDSDYMHARHYWWKLGRFLSADPIQGSLAVPQSWNRYAYVLGNPMNLVDPTGMVEEAPAVDDPCAEDRCKFGETITVWGSISIKFGRLSAAYGGLGSSSRSPSVGTTSFSLGDRSGQPSDCTPDQPCIGPAPGVGERGVIIVTGILDLIPDALSDIAENYEEADGPATRRLRKTAVAFLKDSVGEIVPLLWDQIVVPLGGNYPEAPIGPGSRFTNVDFLLAPWTLFVEFSEHGLVPSSVVPGGSSP